MDVHRGAPRGAGSRARSSAGCRPGDSKWLQEQCVGVFLDYNQNARDRTVASAYSVRRVPDVRVSVPLPGDEEADVEPEDLRMDNV